MPQAGGTRVRATRQVAAEAGFTFRGYTVELSGLCPAHAG